jgi:general secretion pathway protein G
MNEYFQRAGIVAEHSTAPAGGLSREFRRPSFHLLFFRQGKLRDSNGKDNRARWAGFTLLELMIVITIILILATLGAGRYEQSVTRAKEAALKQDLFVMRQAIEQFTLDKEAAPSSLDDLVTAGYLRQIPTDPITRRQDWSVETSDFLLDPQQTTTGITDVHSSSEGTSSEGSAYSSW